MPKPSRRKSCKKKQTTPKLEHGLSHIDNLPDDVVSKIFEFKNGLEFNSTLSEIKKIRENNTEYKIDSNKVVSNLLKPIPSKQRMMVFMKPFKTDDSDVYFTERSHERKIFNQKTALEKRLNSSLNYIEIEFNNKLKFNVVDVIK